MAKSNDEFQIETFLSYFGGKDKVKKIIENCPKCGSKVTLDHLPDYKNLYIQETARCYSCDWGQRKVFHTLN